MMEAFGHGAAPSRPCGRAQPVYETAGFERGKLLVAALRTAAALCLALIPAIGANVSQPSRAQAASCFDFFAMTGAGASGCVAASGCSQATAFLARTSGLSGTETSATTAAICGMVTDGTFALLDALYVYATNTTTTANLNWVSTSFNSTPSGSCTFTADVGYTGDVTTCSIDSNFAPATAGGNYALNSAVLGMCDLSSRTTSQNWVEMGAQGTSFDIIQALNNSGNLEVNVNDSSFASTANTNAQASWIASRTGSGGHTAYKNGSSFFVATAASTSLPTGDIGIFQLGAGGGLPSGDQLAYAFFGAGMTGVQVLAMYNRLHTYLVALGVSGC
jgi:hypothetical protein